MPHSNALAWPGDENVIKMEPLVSALRDAGNSYYVDCFTSGDTEQCTNAMQRRTGLARRRNVIKAVDVPASVMPTSNRSGGSMMSLLLGAWSQHTLDVVKTERAVLNGILRIQLTCLSGLARGRCAHTMAALR
ncbi:hypothetical protein GQ600_888 [Phytophthora cactorum]|nr:hypothetical protein GQ600_888 [Phytophthora cactorum]